MPSSARVPIAGSVVSTTYLTREAAKALGDFALGHLVPGLSGGRMVSSVAADVKAKLLQNVASHYYNPVDFDEKFIGEIDTVCDAIVYASQKKGTKADRQATVAVAENFAAVTGGVIGAAAGSVALPAVGTVGGAGVGVAAGKATVGVGYHFFRKTKWAYKKLKGTQGVHRDEAAETLYAAATEGEGRDKLAATAALMIILGDEYDHFMAESELAVDRIADRLKSV